MEIERCVVVPGPPDRAFALVDDLGAYPTWMDLVHDVVELPAANGNRTWDVELRARVGPFARSKRLRMVRAVHDRPHRVVFERREVDEKDHSAWVLCANLATEGSNSVALTMTLTYGGGLWSGAVLQRVLDDHVERGAAALREILHAADG